MKQTKDLTKEFYLVAITVVHIIAVVYKNDHHLA
jgi:hypothetical protein